MGPPWDHLMPAGGRSWGHLGPPWGHFGVIFGPIWAIFGRLGAIQGPSWATLWPSSGLLVSSWVILRSSLAVLGPSWGRFGRTLGHLGAQLGASHLHCKEWSAAGVTPQGSQSGRTTKSAKPVLDAALNTSKKVPLAGRPRRGRSSDLRPSCVGPRAPNLQHLWFS